MIYLDNHGSTPVDPRWIASSAFCMEHLFANPSSAHSVGKKAKAVIAEAKQNALSLLEGSGHQAVFTSCATEALNQLLYSIASKFPGAHVISSELEHDCVYQTILHLQKQGKLRVSFCEVDQKGAPSVKSAKELVQPDTKLLCLMGANNETGVRTHLRAFDDLALKHSLFFLIDAVAQAGREPLYTPKSAFAQVISAHKICAPRGAAAILYDPRFPIVPLLTGGGQQYGLRSGTENTAAIQSLGLACKDLKENGNSYFAFLKHLQQTFESSLLSHLPKWAVVNGENRVPSCSNISFIDCEGEILLAELDRAQVAVSHGSACSSGALEPSRVLVKMGLPKERSLSALRFSFSRFNTEEQVLEAVKRVVEAVRKTVH